MTPTKAQIAERHTPEEINALADELNSTKDWLELLPNHAAPYDYQIEQVNKKLRVVQEMLRAYALSLAKRDARIAELEGG